jgi:hypothetical protein
MHVEPGVQAEEAVANPATPARGNQPADGSASSRPHQEELGSRGRRTIYPLPLGSIANASPWP